MSLIGKYIDHPVFGVAQVTDIDTEDSEMVIVQSAASKRHFIVPEILVEHCEITQDCKEN